ncbi:MAG: putative D-alanyl-D-alanine carboxypeptidase [Actinomycetota bacterium]
MITKLLRRLRRFDHHVVSVDAQRATTSIIVAAVVFFVPLYSAWQVANTAASAATPALTTDVTGGMPAEPLFSVRRIAQTAALEARVTTVRQRLSSVATQLPEQSCLLARADARVVASVRADEAVIPASNMKVLVAAAALDILGEDFRYETRLLGNQVGGVVAGNLWLVGGGDPLLSTRAYPATQQYPTISPTFLDSLADELAASGVTSVTGSVVGDESRYDNERYVPTWGDGIRAIEAGPLGALLVNDGIILGQPLKPASPAVGAATIFTQLLRERGITVIGAPRAGTAPTDVAQLGSLTSAPLAQLLIDVLTNSDNNAAELLLKEIGLARTQSPTRVAGLQAVAQAIEARGVSTSGLVFADGSGLDDSNRVTCTALVAVIESYGLDSSLGQGMALAGTTGTLRSVLTTGPATGKVRAKTGTLRNVKSLSGFFPVQDGAISFALVLNGGGVSNQSAYRPLWDATMKAFGTYNATPRTEDLLPRTK